jgi:hypothetical protein
MITKHAKRMCITASVLFVVVCISFVFACWYLYTQSTLLHERAQLVADNSLRQQAHYKLGQTLESTTIERDTLRTYILTESGAIDFLSDVETDAAQIGVVLKTDTLKPTSGKVYDTLTVQFTISGTEAAVHTMVQALETLPYQSHISKLSITNTAETEAVKSITTGVVELVISLLKP